MYIFHVPTISPSAHSVKHKIAYADKKWMKSLKRRKSCTWEHAVSDVNPTLHTTVTFPQGSHFCFVSNIKNQNAIISKCMYPPFHKHRSMVSTAGIPVITQHPTTRYSHPKIYFWKHLKCQPDVVHAHAHRERQESLYNVCGTFIIPGANPGYSTCYPSQTLSSRALNVNLPGQRAAVAHTTGL